MIRMRLKRVVYKNAIVLGPGPLLQRERDEISKAAFGHIVLVWKQSIIGAERQLAGALTGMTDDCGTEAARIAGRNITLKENPAMSSLA
ncbi:hypothetical protein PS843_05953 [Pseudomonas fluorescens]|nr:hypothetical protein PS843_05953 [Pseudomonas fluorescens]